jgi:hypothetical protein
MNKKLKYICYLPAWNESYYDYFKKVLSLKEPPRLIDSSKIILWDAYKGNVVDITLPFDTSLITIDDLINDSIIQFTFKSMKYLLSPGQSFSDTIVNIEKEKKRVIKYTKSFEIRNYGLILKKNLIDLEEREKRSLRENMIRDSIDMNELNRSE